MKQRAVMSSQEQHFSAIHMYNSDIVYNFGAISRDPRCLLRFQIARDCGSASYVA